MHRLAPLAIVGFACTAQAQVPPLEFKGLALGAATKEQLLEKLPKFDCRYSTTICSLSSADISRDCILSAVKNRTSSIECSGLSEPYRFGPAVPSHTFVRFDAGKMVVVDMTVTGGTLWPYVEALTEKYGKPAVETEALQNRMGAKFENSIYTWKLRDGEIRAERYSGGFENSRIRLSAPGFDPAADAAKAAERAKASAKSL